MPENRVFSPGFKLAAVQRLVAGEKVKALAEELEVSRQLLYRWWSQYERGGAAALRLPGRPRKTAAVIESASPPRNTRGRRRRGPPESRRGLRGEQAHRRAGAQGRRPGAGDRTTPLELRAAPSGATQRALWRR